jgi:hypothetical protein
MAVRAFDRLSSGAAAAMNLVSCGGSESGDLPCWFPGEPALWLIARDGATTPVVLEGLPSVPVETLINMSAPPRPIRDAFVERDGTLWILSAGSPTGARRDEAPGGWMLARYSPQGRLIDRRDLPEAVRLLLRARDGTAVVVTGRGMVAEVRP